MDFWLVRTALNKYFFHIPSRTGCIPSKGARAWY
jgi:hypothetical protein